MEQWIDVIDFEGIYQVSNFGQIRCAKTGKIKNSQFLKLVVDHTLVCGKTTNLKFAALTNWLWKHL